MPSLGDRPMEIQLIKNTAAALTDAELQAIQPR